MVTGGEAESSSTDSSREEDRVVEDWGCSLWIASFFSMKWEARSSIENEEKGEGFGGLKGENVSVKSLPRRMTVCKGME